MNSEIKRRDFLKTIGAGTSYLALSSPLIGINACTNLSGTDHLYKTFVNPPSNAKPFFRWWWNGNILTKEEVERELELMHSAGAGGVEINPIELHQKVKTPKGKALEWLSKEWIEILEAALKKGNNLGMISDMIIGTGWPFGGKFLSDTETIQGHDLFVEKISGPALYEFDKANLKEGAIIKQAKLIPVPVNNTDAIIDVTSDTQKGFVVIPKGQYEISVVSWRNKFREVMFGAPGGDGPVLDHFNKTAVEKYLQRTEDGLKPTFGANLGKHIRSVFCDSIELQGANWTNDFRKEFEKRNEYDICEYLPLILNDKIQADGDFQDTLLRVRFDYYSTLSELFMERFILPYHKWCHKVGVKSRYQAYGHPWIPTDLLDGNMVPDIPEGDQWLFNGGWTATQIDQIRYAIWDKYTSSAAHLRGLKTASCEAMTNTSGVFSASLEYIKQATDINIVAGINHLVLHGWNYSPKAEGFPGWIRFGTYFNEQNPWFRYLSNWMEYAARLSAVFQNSQAVCQVAIIGPTSDRWSESGLNRNPFLAKPWYLHSLWQAMNHHGYCSDYLNQRVFSEANYENGKINYGPMQYEVLILCRIETATPEFMDALNEYANSGGKIIFIDSMPNKGPGMEFKNSTIIDDKRKALLQAGKNNIVFSKSPQQGNVPALTVWTNEILKTNGILPGVQISKPDERLFLYQAENNGKPVFFFSNQNRDKSIDFEATFNNNNLHAWKWDAETGEKYPFSTNSERINIQLKPLESLLLVFSEKNGKIAKKVIPKETIKTDLSRNWTAECTTPEGKKFELKIPVLKDLLQIPETETFGGTITYTKTFHSKKATILNLGKVAETAELLLNGKNLGVKYWGERVFDVSGIIKEGENRLEIKVTTLLWNYCNSKSMEENPMAKHWANSNRLKDNKPLATGLIGPVILS